MTQTNAFLPPDLNCSDAAALEPLFRQLIDRPIQTPADLGGWLDDVSALTAVIDEHETRLHIDHACHTEDEAIEKAFMHFVQQVEPRLKPLYFELKKKFVASALREQLTGPGLALMGRKWACDVELFREENVPLETRQTELETRYGKICGAMMVEHDGQTWTLQQAARYLEEPDRPTRQAVWEKIRARRLEDRAELDRLFDDLLALRHRIARQAGFADFRQYMWQAKKRFDYTPEDCLAFGDAVERLCVPIVRRMQERRAEAMGVAPLRPWDTAVDVKGRPALKPFDAADIGGLIDKTRAVFARVDPMLADRFAKLAPGRNLDLESRRGKRPGGFQSSLEVVREPFIFMNAAGLQRDVETLLHEAGHAFHYQAACDEPNVYLRHAPLEFCEVASMSMELIGAEHLDVFYPDPSDRDRAWRRMLEDIVGVLCWIATIDGFQHWLYTHPGHSPEERTGAWLGLLDRFSGGAVEWSGYESSRASMWQRQLHLYQVPFYYIEYGIAQLGALQVWRRCQQDAPTAMADLERAFALGDKAPLPELFEAAGIRFDFTAGMMQPLMEAVGQELERLPA